MSENKKICPNCGEKVNTDTETCPNCGHAFEKKPANSDKVSQHSSSINKAYVIISLIIVGVIVVGYFMIGDLEIAGTYIEETTLNDAEHERTAEILNSGRTTLRETDRSRYTASELTFNTVYDEAADSYVFDPEEGVEATYAIELQGVADFGLPPQFEKLEETYGFSREDEDETIILTGHLAGDDVDILDIDFQQFQIEAVGEDILINGARFINQEEE